MYLKGTGVYEVEVIGRKKRATVMGTQGSNSHKRRRRKMTNCIRMDKQSLSASKEPKSCEFNHGVLGTGLKDSGALHFSDSLLFPSVIPLGVSSQKSH